MTTMEHGKPRVLRTREELNGELARFAQARLAEADNSGKPCEMAFGGELSPRGRFARWTCSECGAMSFRPVQLGAPPFCQACGARCRAVKSCTDSVQD